MLVFLVVLLFVVPGVVTALGFLTGWLSGRYQLPAMNVVFVVLTLLPVAFFLYNLIAEATTLSHQFSAQAHLLSLYQWGTWALFGVAAALTFRASVRSPWLAFAPLPVACAAFYWLLLRPTYQHAVLVNLYDLKGNSAFFILCGFSTLALFSLGGGYAVARKAITPMPDNHSSRPICEDKS